MSDPLAVLGLTAAPTPGPAAERSRTPVVDALRLDARVVAVWEGGSAAFGRADAGSDVDIVVAVEPGAEVGVLDVMEDALRAAADHVDVWDAGVTPFGHQRFWLPRAAQSMALVDTAVTAVDDPSWSQLLEPERHGSALVLHDPQGVLVDAVSRARLDLGAHRARIAERVEVARARRVVFDGFVEKELARNRTIDAQAFLRRLVVDHLVELLGVRWRPLRFDFQLRYLHDELPAAVVERLLPIIEPVGDEALIAAAVAARDWIDELLGEIDVDALPLEAHAESMHRVYGVG